MDPIPETIRDAFLQDLTREAVRLKLSRPEQMFDDPFVQNYFAMIHRHMEFPMADMAILANRLNMFPASQDKETIRKRLAKHNLTGNTPEAQAKWAGIKADAEFDKMRERVNKAVREHYFNEEQMIKSRSHALMAEQWCRWVGIDLSTPPSGADAPPSNANLALNLLSLFTQLLQTASQQVRTDSISSMPLPPETATPATGSGINNPPVSEVIARAAPEAPRNDIAPVGNPPPNYPRPPIGEQPVSQQGGVEPRHYVMCLTAVGDLGVDLELVKDNDRDLDHPEIQKLLSYLVYMPIAPWDFMEKLPTLHERIDNHVSYTKRNPSRWRLDIEQAKKDLRNPDSPEAAALRKELQRKHLEVDDFIAAFLTD